MSSTKTRVQPLRAPTAAQQTTPEQRYWRGFTNTQLVKEHNAITHIHFNPVSPHDFAVTSSTRIQVFGSKTRQVVKTFSRFKETVYSGEFRHDGRLLVAGDASGLVQIFDAHQPRTLLVTLNPSTHPTHVTKFHPTNSTNLLTCSDDRVARLYDITSAQAPVMSFDDHSDYIRTAAFIPSSNLITTGCYDGFVRIFDARIGGSAGPIAKFDQGAPVEAVMALSPTTLVTAGGTSVKVWDMAGGKLVRDLSNFTKTVTCLADAGDRGVLAGSLDGHVKIFDSSEDWAVKFGWKFGGGVLSCGVSPDHKHFVAGLTSGLLSVRTRKTQPRVKQGVKQQSKSNSFARMMRGAEYTGEYEHRIVSDKPKPTKKLRPFEKHLNGFRWAEAFDAAFTTGQAKEVTITILNELRARGKVRVALSGRDEASLEPLIRWSHKNIEDVKCVDLVADYVSVCMEMYGAVVEKAPVLEELLLSLKKKVGQEVEKAKEASRVEGMLALLSV
ncbi:hypothetical protein BABINDRAFT_170780 [Babjeviella inositovora NRRL Y-12698]|uniref:U3 small nucleolar RNA-associated protein 15 C-terminal domain-containing protein n=1 Tax=Babjeviella inositovora NRRL Y-12698 TaxID=984486 RepID=A0A1E3QVY3_9ASCO|nr:uncharacterized protein BABINDRAFT_170780 [Babjeviella inositovora NRRL Y-12698]ODQ81137.1 hypothetical protein BABINDRAFT_170780 [Babjeviella inositovora NRRL Y-12698]